jgi:hypothetical protein
MPVKSLERGKSAIIIIFIIIIVIIIIIECLFLIQYTFKHFRVSMEINTYSRKYLRADYIRGSSLPLQYTIYHLSVCFKCKQ